MQLNKFYRTTSLLAIAVMMNLSSSTAQNAIDQAHVEPRTQRSQTDSMNSVAKTGNAIIRETVNLVLVPVTVMDPGHRIVTGLQQENFQLYEDKHPQLIKHFWKEDAPVSVGIVLDVSSSMQTKIERARDAVIALLQASNPQDEFFLTTFADQPSIIQDFTSNADDIRAHLVFAVPKWRTSLLDAVVLSISNMKKARYPRKALVIISDGGDNRSRYTEKDVKSLVKENDVLVYSIGVFDREFQTHEERLGPELLAGMSEITGASAYTLDNPNYLPMISEHIAVELRNQYVLGYCPNGSRRDGKWKKIKVALVVPRRLPALRVQARTGYFSAAE